jgi:hypothetical protein
MRRTASSIATVTGQPTCSLAELAERHFMQGVWWLVVA